MVNHPPLDASVDIRHYAAQEAVSYTHLNPAAASQANPLPSKRLLKCHPTL